MILTRSNGRVLLLVAICALTALSATLLTASPDERHSALSLNTIEPESSILIDINRASYPEILSIEGIGPTLAQRILSYRMLHGPLLSWEELDQIRGIGPAVIHKIRSTPGVCLGHECDMR